MKVLLASLIALTPVSVLADEYQAGYSHERKCYRSEYREEYVPGTSSSPGYVSCLLYTSDAADEGLGYVKSFSENIEVPCQTKRAYKRKTTIEYDNNDCSDGKIAGALLGGGAGAAMSRGDGRWWAIPLGAVVGGTIGCDLDGG